MIVIFEGLNDESEIKGNKWAKNAIIGLKNVAEMFGE